MMPLAMTGFRSEDDMNDGTDKDIGYQRDIDTSNAALEYDRELTYNWNALHPSKLLYAYLMRTNMKVTRRSIPNDVGDMVVVPGFFEVLMAHQGNKECPYTVTNCCIKYKLKHPKQMPDGTTKTKEKRIVPLDKVESTFNRTHLNTWMFQVIDSEGHKYVLKLYNKEGRLDVAVFVDTHTDDDGNLVYDDDNKALTDRFNKFINPMIYGDDAMDVDEDNDADDESTYEMPDDQVPSSDTGIAVITPQYGADDADNNATDDGKTGTAYVVMSVLSLIGFGIQAFLTYMITHGFQLTAVFGVLAVVSLVSLIIAIGKHSARVNGDSTVSLTVPKVLSTILIVLLVVEIVAIIAIFALYKMKALPAPLQFLYTTL